MAARGMRIAWAAAALCAGLASAGSAAAAQAELPELARSGPHAVGTALAATRAADGANRSVGYRVWYPAPSRPRAAAVRYRHVLERPGRPPLPLTLAGVARADAPAAPGRFPLVVLSHGYGGWAARFAPLAETLASRGYVVAAVEHEDAPAAGPAAQRASFAAVLTGRGREQRAVIADLLARSAAAAGGFAGTIDGRSIGLIGYSMGGYGALASAGACHDGTAAAFALLTAAQRAALAACGGPVAGLRALVLLAPWGGAPDARAWSAASLARVTAPVLILSGDEDDVVDHRDGVRWIRDGLVGSERRMLVYREARHNILGDEWAAAVPMDFAARESFAEPVWRSDRIRAINAHIIVAFADLALKGDASRRAWLDVPVADANRGRWAASGGAAAASGALAGPEQDGYWRGFQRRWALGVEMHRTPPEPRR